MSETLDPFTGGCLCGAIRYRALGAPTRVNHCHCRQCQQSSGAAMLTWVTWPLEAVRLTQGRTAEFASSPGVQRSFCARCGSTLFWRRLSQSPAVLDVAAGTLDAPERVPPQEHLFVKSRAPWLALCDGLPAYLENRPKE
jgi:hypothetical protein